MTVASLAYVLATVASAQEQTFQRSLQRSVSVVWQQQELASALSRLASTAEVHLWLDRRVDRQKKISARIDNRSLREALQIVAEEHQLGYAEFETLVYIGPQETTALLGQLSTRVKRSLDGLPKSLRKRWLRSAPTEWPHLSEPRQLIQSWLKSANLKVIGGDQLPHDLWRGQTLPPMSLIDRVVLTLAGFDLTARISHDGKSCEIVPIPVELIQTAESASRETRPQPASKKSGKKTEQRFTLRLQNQPLGKVLDHFAQQLELDVIWETASLEAQSRKRLVTCDVNQVDLDELLTSALRPLKLRHTRQGNRITIKSTE